MRLARVYGKSGDDQKVSGSHLENEGPVETLWVTLGPRAGSASNKMNCTNPPGR
jgi:hypothetical protein